MVRARDGNVPPGHGFKAIWVKQYSSRQKLQDQGMGNAILRGGSQEQRRKPSEFSLLPVHTKLPYAPPPSAPGFQNQGGETHTSMEIVSLHLLKYLLSPTVSQAENWHGGCMVRMAETLPQELAYERSQQVNDVQCDN